MNEPMSRPFFCAAISGLWGAFPATSHRLAGVLSLVILGACGSPPQAPTMNHVRFQQAPVGQPPNLVEPPVMPPMPVVGRPKAAVYSVSVHNVPVRDLLFAVARDAKLNLDVHPDLAGKVSINAIDQTITEILDRVALQIDMRYELDQRNIFVMPDSPVLRHYTIDYLNVARESNSELKATGTIGRASGAGNASSSSLVNKSDNRFWATLTQNIRDLLRETDKVFPGEAEGGGANSQGAARPAAAPVAAVPGLNNNAAPSGANTANASGQSAEPPPVRFREAAYVISNPETGVISVRASHRQHAKVREFIDRVVNGAKRQVLIEATIVEVNLNDQYQQGVNWSVLRNGLPLLQLGPAGGNMPSGVPVNGIIPSTAFFTDSRSVGSQTQLSAAIRLLESFGNTKVLSSPKISALNNQAALLKVTEDIVYFTISANYQPGSLTLAPILTISSTPNTVSVGFVMSVMPQISDDDQVTLILKPTLSRVLSYVEDPGVAIVLNQARANGSTLPDVSSKVPQIQTREMESVVKIRSGDTAVLGGLMREDAVSNTDQTPGLGNVPGLGELFKYKSRTGTKSELVIFLKPTVVTSPSLTGDYSGFRKTLEEVMKPTEDHPARVRSGLSNFGVDR